MKPKKIQISVQVIDDKEIIKEVRNYAKIRSVEEQKLIESIELSEKNNLR
jgi:hypothetical protein